MTCNALRNNRWGASSSHLAVSYLCPRVNMPQPLGMLGCTCQQLHWGRHHRMKRTMKISVHHNCSSMGQAATEIKATNHSHNSEQRSCHLPRGLYQGPRCASNCSERTPAPSCVLSVLVCWRPSHRNHPTRLKPRIVESERRTVNKCYKDARDGPCHAAHWLCVGRPRHAEHTSMRSTCAAPPGEMRHPRSRSSGQQHE